MDPKHLVHLAAVLEKGSISGAARTLSITQPTLTRNMATLEMQAAAQLFTRSRFGVRSTVLGEALAREGRAIARRLQDATASIARHKMGQIEHLRLGTGPWLGMSLVPRLSMAFMRAMPEVALTVTIDRPGMLLDALLDGQLDLVIAAALAGRAPQGIDRLTLASDSLGVFCGLRHPLAKRRRVPAQAMADAKWITTGPTSPFQPEEAEFLRRNGVRRQHVPFATVGDAFAALKVLEQGQHLAVLPRVAIALMQPRPAVNEIRLTERPVPRDVQVWLPRADTRPAAVQAVIGLAQALLAAPSELQSELVP